MPLDLANALQGDSEAVGDLLAAVADWLHGDAPSPLTASSRRRYWTLRRAEATTDLFMALPRQLSLFEAAHLAADVIEHPPAEYLPITERILDAQAQLGGGPLTPTLLYRILRDAACIQNFY
jgi:hypothetical protein